MVWQVVARRTRICTRTKTCGTSVSLLVVMSKCTQIGRVAGCTKMCNVHNVLLMLSCGHGN